MVFEEPNSSGERTTIDMTELSDGQGWTSLLLIRPRIFPFQITSNFTGQNVVTFT